MIDPSRVAMYKPDGLSRFKSELFDRIGGHLQRLGGQYIKYDIVQMDKLPADFIPIVGCMPEATSLIVKWRDTKRNYGYWDRGYCRRIFATWLPRAETGSGYYRWHVNSFQSQVIRDVPDDRWKALKTDISPWQKNGRHIVIAAPTRTYARFHRCETWVADTIDTLARNTTRQLVIRDKESKRPLQEDIAGAHALVTHGSIAAVESVILGCPVFVHPDSAASLVGMTDLTKIEKPVYPERQQWLNTLSYSQFDERELVDGTLWRLLQ